MYFVEKEGPAVSAGEEAGAVAVGAGEGALGVAEKLAFEKGGGNGVTIDGDEGGGGARALFVQEARDEFFSGAGLADQKGGGFGLSGFSDEAAKILNGGGHAD